jgi:LytS/YehU family sensor histidine kinase
MPQRPWARFARAAAYALVVAVLLTVVFMAAYSLAMPGGWDKKLDEFLVFRTWFFAFTSHLWILLAWVAIYIVLINTDDLRERDRRLAAAERAAQQAQLAALRLQIHPHFLFNALNALSGLVNLGRREDAEEMIHNLSAFLRRTLRADPGQMTPLRDEIDMQMMYLGIERTRFSDRLRIECHIPDDCGDAVVPNLILQPLVENVIKHALAPSETPITLTIGAMRRGDILEVWVKDDGACAAPAKPGLGIGLRNVAERLRALFGEAGNLAVGRESDHWVSRVTLPWKSSKPCVS